MYQSVFLFDYVSYQSLLKSLVPFLDKGDFLPILAEAKTIFNNVNPDNWVLQNNGTSLENLNTDEIRNQADVGYLLLVILSKFLEPIPGIRYWGTFSGTLETVFDWDERDIELIVNGLNTCLLFTQNCTPPKTLTIDTPYWFWVRPTQSRKSGWLPVNEIKRLLEDLHSIRDNAWKPSSKSTKIYFNLDNLTHDETKRFQEALKETIYLLEVSVTANQGLFLVTS